MGRGKTSRSARATVLALGVTIVVCATASCGSGGNGSAATTSSTATPSRTQSATASVPAGQLGGALTSQSIPNVEKLFAGDGIATVPDESSTAALSPVNGQVVMSFTRAQVASMTVQAADHGGIAGAVLDATYSMPAGDVPISYLLAAWVSTGSSPGAAAVRSAMGREDWSEAPAVVFPSVGLALFAADVAHASIAQAVANGKGSRGAGTASTTAEDGPRVDVVLDAAELGTDSPCSTVSNFVQGVLDTVFHALQLNGPSGSSVIDKIGSFFVSLWNTAVSLAQFVIQGLVKVVGGAVVSAIQTAAGLTAIIAQVVSDVTPWSVSVTAKPPSVPADSGGSFTATVSSGPGPSGYPSAVSDCASGLAIPLPNMSAEGASGTWALSPAVIPTSSTSVVLDDHASATISFTTTAPSGCSAHPSETTGTAQITVNRPGVDQLKDMVDAMLTNGFGVAGSIVAPVLQQLLEPLVDDVLGKLSSLTQVTGSGSVSITEPSSDSEGCTPTSTPNSTPSSSSLPTTLQSCLVGTWRTTNQRIVPHVAPDYGGAGAIWTVAANGDFTVDYSGASPFHMGLWGEAPE